MSEPSPTPLASTSTLPSTQAADQLVQSTSSSHAPSNAPRQTTYSTRPAARPPARVGAPPSNRNFADSSASGPPPGPANAGPRMARGPLKGHGAGLGAGASAAGGASSVVTAESRKKKEAWGETYVMEEDSLRNDYSSNYVRTGSRPQNHLRGADLDTRFSEYPKLASLLKQKHLLLSSPSLSVPPTYLPLSPASALQILPPSKFDAILLSPPPSVTYEELSRLDLGRISDTPSFVWLRCEDIVWLKTNKKEPEKDLEGTSTELFKSTVEHCLMGIRGTVRRSTDANIVHCNVDTDVMVWEGDPADPDLKPPELHSLIENFCQGTRRLHLFGSKAALRRGWLTVGEGLGVGSGLGMEMNVRKVEGETEEWKPVEWEREKWEATWAREGEVLGEGTAKRKPTLLPYVPGTLRLRPQDLFYMR
ncbi:methyltransferase like 14, transcription regulator [Pseudohyphozyma bogoriensis]|nr:methyltransferase like 14, transcription regulator [Pseudohyphozyma bogoriensis]